MPLASHRPVDVCTLSQYNPPGLATSVYRLFSRWLDMLGVAF